jgi:hypothetical protein
MRLWSIHPSYLDSAGLVALWRETLLAQDVLKGKTKGYKNHPQLDRFKKSKTPVASLAAYLQTVYDEATNRGFDFDNRKISPTRNNKKITVTDSQLAYEFNHLLQKLKNRDTNKYKEIKDTKNIKTNPLFKSVKGDIEEWEKIPDK